MKLKAGDTTVSAIKERSVQVEAFGAKGQWGSSEEHVTVRNGTALIPHEVEMKSSPEVGLSGPESSSPKISTEAKGSLGDFGLGVSLPIVHAEIGVDTAEVVGAFKGLYTDVKDAFSWGFSEANHKLSGVTEGPNGGDLPPDCSSGKMGCGAPPSSTPGSQ